MLLTAVVLSLAPYKGPALAGAVPGATQYALAVRGKPNQRVDLHADGLPDGWIASFCTGNFCSPFRYTAVLDAKGNAVVEFQAVRTDDRAPRRVRVTVHADGGASVSREVTAR